MTPERPDPTGADVQGTPSGRGAGTPSGGEAGEVPEWINDPSPQPAAAQPVYAPAARRRTIDAATLASLQTEQVPVTPRRSARKRASRRRRVLLTIGGIIVVLVLIVVGGLFWVQSHLDGKGGAAVDVTLPAGAGHGTLASDLSKAHVIGTEWLFKRYLDYKSQPPVANGGTYVFHLHEGYRAALDDLAKGPKPVDVRLTIPEGYDLQQIADAVGKLPGLSSQRFMQIATSGAVHSEYSPPNSNNLEGLLFPDTYFVAPGETEQTILQAMVDRFDQVGDSIGLNNSAAADGLQPYQAIVLASLVEKEAKVEADRGKIAQVILNRLKDGMKLQIDATVEYAEGVHKTRLLDSDLKTDSPYNTYLVSGLPPGPIASPGKASLQAALTPTPGTWLYYVLISPDGSHAFATTPQEFARLKAQAHAEGLL
jgi:UPF0755 protein